MKKYLLIICVLILGLVLNASMDHAQDSPTAQGGSLVAGAFSFSSAGGALFEEEGERFNIIQFNPSISYFIAPGLAIGGKLIFSRLLVGENHQTALGFGPQLTYFFGGTEAKANAKGTTYPYLGTSFVYMRNSSEDFFDKFEVTGTALSFGGGITHMVTNSVGLFSELSYEIDKIENVDGNKLNVVAGFLVFL